MKVKATQHTILSVEISPLDAILALREELRRRSGVSTDPNVIIIDTKWVWVDPYPHDGDQVIKEADQEAVSAWRGLDVLERYLK